MYRKFPVLLLATALSTAFYASPHAQTPDSGKIHIPPPDRGAATAIRNSRIQPRKHPDRRGYVQLRAR